MIGGDVEGSIVDEGDVLGVVGVVRDVALDGSEDQGGG